MAHGLPPSEFWRQSPRSFVAIMEGCSRRHKRQTDLAFSHAWHTVAFDRMKHHDFKGALDRIIGRKAKPQTTDEMLNVFRAIQAKGAPMNIKKLH